MSKLELGAEGTYTKDDGMKSHEGSRNGGALVGAGRSCLKDGGDY